MTKKTRDNYHHGDLRQAVLDLARRRIDKGDAEKLSMRSLATKIGVAHRAIYNHFADKDALLSAVAAGGYHELSGLLAKTRNAAEFVRTYATFALNHGHLYTIMMNRSYAQFENVPELRTGADAMIATSIAVLAPDQGSDDDKRRAVMRYWMLVHGGVGLHSSGTLKARPDEDFIKELLAVAGLGPAPDEASQALWSTEKESPQ
ncbi:TetR/AcrR family transcriptional regulator [Sphingorhabdus sp. EL138]|uniref:TetR/AcrR family transcriptional regulator n=1 Tax=Sphingorhabdus sp. EL138 TaxID=2073156 RepID=UPI000D69D29A|nr:TetR/AcrR family transcriptional regulator [Sphingorhabdus sp. EL138]